MRHATLNHAKAASGFKDPVRSATISALQPYRTLQRKCACGGDAGLFGECAECQSGHRPALQRAGTGRDSPMSVPPIVREVLRSPGQPLDAGTRAFMEPRFGHDFSKVRVHADVGAAESAGKINAAAYTVAQDIVFGAGKYAPRTAKGERLLAHELTHVVQQSRGQSSGAGVPQFITRSSSGEGFHISAAPFDPEHSRYEHEANVIAAQVLSQAPGRAGSETQAGPAVQHISTMRYGALQPFTLPDPISICGASVTDIDVLPARPRPLVECDLPPTLLVTRMNIVGRAKTPASTGGGRLIFNLHIGYYQDPATGRWCGVLSDSKRCLTPACMISCLPTFEEAIQFLREALWAILKILGIAVLVIIIALIIVLMPELSPVFVLASRKESAEPDGAAV
jgi:hypothetical protein